MLKELSKKMSSKIAVAMSLAFAFAVSVILPASAAIDSDLQDTISTSTAMVADLKVPILAFFGALAVLVLTITVGKGALIMAIRWVKKAIFGGKKKR